MDNYSVILKEKGYSFFPSFLFYNANNGRTSSFRSLTAKEPFQGKRKKKLVEAREKYKKK